MSARLSVDAAGSDLGAVLARHGYAIIHGLPESLLVRLAACDQTAAALLGSCENTKELLRIPERRLTTRAHSSSMALQSLPLIGVGVHAVRDGDRLQRTQLHLVTDSRALALVPWPRNSPLRDDVTTAVNELHNLATTLLRRLDNGLEGARAAQAESDGDPSVLDIFVYPNQHSSLPNMRAHTDPGLLTLTVASEVPGLEIRDRSTGEWIDVEALCDAGSDLIVFCGEALSLATNNRYAATLHRVRHHEGGKARVSTVFELRIGSVPNTACVASGGSCSMDTFAADEDEEEATEEVAAGVEYCLSFVRARLAGGSSPADILREFRVGANLWPPDLNLNEAELGRFVFDWVRGCREREAVVAAFAEAEYVEVTPAFGDCTGRYVEVRAV